MAEQQPEFAYHNIELFKSQSLGSGSYGGVCKAKCDGLPCAAKIMHPTLFDLHDTGAVSYLRKFHEECHLLSLARHPNVVQYLATYCDPDTQLPVLLMEICDESLTAFLERFPGPLSYHIQLNICHDIALALVYLHSNGLIHRDLTGNNVLMIAGPRAKITDFGMSKLASVNPRMTALTLCPGNVLYMSPEALDEAKTYTAKLDVFSFGVIVVQILIRQFPNPTDRFRLVSVPQFEEALRQVVPETERREAHLKLIPDTHSLKPLTLQCLKKKENERPSAVQLSERLSELKQSSQYRESMHQTQSSSDIQQLQQQLQGQRILTEAKTREVQTQTTELESVVEDKNRQLQSKDRQLQANARQLQEKQHTIEMKERELQQTRGQLRASEQLVSEFQQSLQQKDKTITDLHQTISHGQPLEQQDTASRHQPQQQPVTTPHTTVAAAQKDISKMTWREGKNAPEKIFRRAAAVHGNTAYFTLTDSYKIHAYQNIRGQEHWYQLPENNNQNFGLAVVGGSLTSVGGGCIMLKVYTNTLLSLTGQGEKKWWSVVFPPMPTPRLAAACVTTEQVLVVAGGYAGGDLATVEVMNISTKQWTTVSHLPQKHCLLSGIVCGETLYLAGGYSSIATKPLTSVLACSLPELLNLNPTNSLTSKIRRSFPQSAWRNVGSLPVQGSTLASLNGHLLAIGGRDYNTWNSTSDVYRYDPRTDSWNVVSQMKIKRSHCLAVTLPEDCLVIVGGLTEAIDATYSVEILQ